MYHLPHNFAAFLTRTYRFLQGGPECKVMQRITLTLYAQ